MPLRFDCRLFGPPQILFDGKPLPLGRLQWRALLYRLAVDLKPVPREALVFLFWPDEPDARARRLLTQLLSHLRKQLPDPKLLLVTKEHIQLDPTFVESDTATFERLCSQRGEARQDKLHKAVALYTGKFLTGVSLPEHPEYEIWLAYEQRRLERLYLDALHTLAEYYRTQKRPDDVMEMARRYLAVDELAERMHQFAMEALALNGDRAASIRQYQTCVAVLDRELGVTPLPETEAIYRTVLFGAVTPDTGRALAWVPVSDFDIPLVGRQEILHELMVEFRHAQTSYGAAILLTGEAGLGKTRLLQGFTSLLQNEAVILNASCYPSAHPTPFQSIVDALRPAISTTSLAQKVSSVWLHEASLLFPELTTRDTAQHSRSEATPQEAQGRLFEALRVITMALSKGVTPIVLCLDDMQWADQATLDWLVYLSQHIQQSRMLLLCACRPEESEKLAHLRQGFGRLSRKPERHLAPLSQRDTEQILHHMGLRMDIYAAARLWQVTGGNPFFVVETARALLEAGYAADGETGGDEIPIADTVRDAIVQRLNRLQPLARQILEAGAVWGAEFPFAFAWQTAGRNEMESLAAMEELVGRRILSEEKKGYRFDHELIRAVTYRSLSHHRRRLLHRRTAETLARSLPEMADSQRIATVAAIGHHFAEAEEGDQAVPFLLEAGDYARNLYDYSGALGLYERALGFMDDQADPAFTARILMKVGLTHHMVSHYAEARRAYERSFALNQRSAPIQPRRGHSSPGYHLHFASPYPDPINYDPDNFMGTTSVVVIRQLFSGLVDHTGQLDVIPDVAYGWDVEDGGRTYRFHLRDDALWNDGQPVTAHDFLLSWQRYSGRDNDFALADRVIHLEIPGPHTLVMRLNKAAGHFLHLLSHPAAYPIPSHVVEKYGEDWLKSAHLVTNGPYQLESWEPDRAIVFARNPHYHGHFTGNVERVTHYSVGNWAQNLAAYRRGEVDVLGLPSVPTPDVVQARFRHADDFAFLSTFLTDILLFNQQHPPLQDVRVRQALAMTIRQEELADRVEKGFVSPAQGGFVPPGMPGHAPQITLPFDPARACQLLAEAGFPDGRGFPPTKLLVVDDFARRGTYFQACWREFLGVEIEIDAVPWPEWMDRIYGRRAEFHIYQMGFPPEYFDPYSILFEAHNITHTGWRDERFERMTEASRQTTDQAERHRLYRAMDTMLVEEAVLIPLLYHRTGLLLQPWVKHYPFNPIWGWYWKDTVVERE